MSDEGDFLMSLWFN